MTPSRTYEDLQKEGLGGRELEASVLSRAARKLNRCAKAWNQRESPKFREQLDEALSFNQRLWTFLQVELSDASHPMPRDLRRNLLRLSRYVDRTILRLYSGGKLRDLESLCQINEQIAAGLLIAPPQQQNESERVVELTP